MTRHKTRPDMTKPDQTWPDQTRHDQTRWDKTKNYLPAFWCKIYYCKTQWLGIFRKVQIFKKLSKKIELKFLNFVFISQSVIVSRMFFYLIKTKILKNRAVFPNFWKKSKISHRLPCKICTKNLYFKQKVIILLVTYLEIIVQIELVLTKNENQFFKIWPLTGHFEVILRSKVKHVYIFGISMTQIFSFMRWNWDLRHFKIFEKLAFLNQICQKMVKIFQIFLHCLWSALH